MIGFYLWLMVCGDPTMTVECQLFKLSAPIEYSECWNRAYAYRETLTEGPAQNYKVWCSNRDYIKDLEK